MLRLNSEVKIGKFRLPAITEIKIESSQDLLLDFASIEFYGSKKDTKGKKILDFIKNGDEVEIKLGYNDNLKTYFKGFLTQIATGGDKVRLDCLDEGYAYANLSTTKYYNVTKTTFKKLLNLIAPKIPLNVVDAEIGDWEIQKDVQIFEVIDEIKKKIGVFPYFRNGILTMGVADINATFTADFQKNCPSSGGDSKLEVSFGLNAGTHVKGVSRGIVNNKTGIITSYYSDKGVSSSKPSGTAIGTIEIPNLTLQELNDLLKIKYESLNTKGLVGEITTYGEPRLEHGMICKIQDTYRSDINNAQVYINAVNTIFNESEAFKQKLKLGKLK
jgi:hypothetical protein